MYPMSESVLKDASTSELEAFVQLVVLVAYADGDLSGSEEQVLLSSVQQLAAGRVDEAHLRSLMHELPPLSRSSNNWRKDRIDALKSDLKDDTLRKEAFRLAVKVARTDNHIGLREGRMLVNIVTELGIDSAFAQQTLSETET